MENYLQAKYIVPAVLVVALVLFLVIVRWVGGTISQEGIVVSVPNWPSAKAKANIIAKLVRDEFGVTVELIDSTNTVIYAAMDKGTMHVHPEVWLPNHQNLHDQYVHKKKTVRQGGSPADADQGICTTADSAKRTGIVNLVELANAEMASKFDSDGNGKGEIWIGASGWSSTNIERIRAKSYGYDKTMKLVEMDEVLALANLAAAIERKSNIVFYCYSPHHMFLEYDLLRLREDPHDPAQWSVLQPSDDPEWLKKSRAFTAWRKASLYIYYASSLEETHPEIARMLSKIAINSDATAQMTHALAVENVPVKDFAREWITKNRALIETWLK